MSNLSFEEAINNLSDDDVKVRKEAIESLVGVTDEEAIEPLIKATTDDNAQVRFKAAEILGSMGDVAVDKLTEEFKNAEGKDKRFLAYSSGNTSDPNYNKQASLYHTIAEQFVAEGTQNPDGS